MIFMEMNPRDTYIAHSKKNPSIGFLFEMAQPGSYPRSVSLDGTERKQTEVHADLMASRAR